VALRDFEKAHKIIDRALAFDPTALAVLEMNSKLAIREKGDFSVAEKAFEAVKSAPLNDEQKIRVATARTGVFLLERKYQEGLQQAESISDDKLASFPDGLWSKYYYIGFARRALHDEPGAREAFQKAKSVAEEGVRRSPNFEDAHIQLAKVLAYLGEREEAVAEAQRAAELLPESKDAYDGPEVMVGVAEIYTVLGNNDRAIQILDGLLSRPSSITVQSLKVNPIWDPLHADPAFQKLCEEKQK